MRRMHHYMHHGYISDEVAKLIVSNIPQNGVAADLGCGSGRFCPILLSKAGRVYCVDVDGYAIRMAKDYVKDERAIFLNEDASSTSIPSGTVDLVIMVNSFHDMEDKAKVASEIGRILKPGGLAIVIESKPGLTIPGPPPWIRMKPEEVLRYFNSELFKPVEVKDLGNFNAIIIRRT
ncbi:class I SAM-dependent methyltransferase [Caldivirga sp. UBA161]|uniref:class I SAM-dependent methyltransferase n=1 Tax=Caldivirga sp. UBA161 TaxID=1915569 RepID=UPI0025B7C20F|nr:class I SAM-dependent methyltransferase [Caldivirga sp. UBA161]